MMVDLLETELARRLPNLEIRTGASDSSIVPPTANEEVGDLTILDDGAELTVYIGTITHGHFNDYTPNNSPDERMRTIVDSLVWFLEDLVADRVLIWRSGGSGGWRIIEGDEQLNVHSDADTQFYFWSGPIG